MKNRESKIYYAGSCIRISRDSSYYTNKNFRRSSTLSKISKINFHLIIFLIIFNIILQKNAVISSKQNRLKQFNDNIYDKMNNTNYDGNSSYKNNSYNKSQVNENFYFSTINKNNIDMNSNVKNSIQQGKKDDENTDNFGRELFDQLTTSNPCLVHYCPKGRECIIETDTQKPNCICLRYCSHRKRPICGSNGQIYENHCELHRASCIQSTPITYQRMENCFQLYVSNEDVGATEINSFDIGERQSQHNDEAADAANTDDNHNYGGGADGVNGANSNNWNLTTGSIDTQNYYGAQQPYLSDFVHNDDVDNNSLRKKSAKNKLFNWLHNNNNTFLKTTRRQELPPLQKQQTKYIIKMNNTKRSQRCSTHPKHIANGQNGNGDDCTNGSHQNNHNNNHYNRHHLNHSRNQGSNKNSKSNNNINRFSDAVAHPVPSSSSFVNNDDVNRIIPSPITENSMDGYNHDTIVIYEETAPYSYVTDIKHLQTSTVASSTIASSTVASSTIASSTSILSVSSSQLLPFALRKSNKDDIDDIDIYETDENDDDESMDDERKAKKYFKKKTINVHKSIKSSAKELNKYTKKPKKVVTTTMATTASTTIKDTSNLRSVTAKYLTDLLRIEPTIFRYSTLQPNSNISFRRNNKDVGDENHNQRISKHDKKIYDEVFDVGKVQQHDPKQSDDVISHIQNHQQKQQHQQTLLSKDYCTSQEYEIMKDNLLLYSHARLISQANNHSKDFLVSVMFSHYDQNNDAHLEYEELNQITIDEHLDELSIGCVLTDMLNYDDNNQDGKLSINEFYQAFSKLYSVSVVSLDKALETNHLSARVGDNVEIKCDVTGTPTPPLIWRRNGIELSSLNEDEIRVYSDGSLYLTRIQLYHSGNYSCHAQRNKDIVQTHVLSVYTVPQVRVTPRIQSKRPGENAEMFCHVIGDPFPKVEWLKNDEPINYQLTDKYQLIGNGTAIHIMNIAYSDTGAYMCQASIVGITVRDISSLIVQEEPAPTVINEERKFFAFYDSGIAVYEPSSCHLYHQIRGTAIIPGTQEMVCGKNNQLGICSWGRAINVGTRYIYVSQPKLNRILVISTIQMVVVEILNTDKNPVELFYVPRLDQVWILCWKPKNKKSGSQHHPQRKGIVDMVAFEVYRSRFGLTNKTIATTTDPAIDLPMSLVGLGGGIGSSTTAMRVDQSNEILKTIQVIRDANKKRKHHVIHPEPIDGQFDLIKHLFLPSNDLEQPHYSYNYGYVTHKNQRGLYKLDLQNLRYTKSVDLTLYNCVPEKVEFSALYGFVIMSCREPVTNRPQGQIVLDYLTDAILTTKQTLIGLPKISPDSRHLITVQHYLDGVVIIVQKIKASGLEFLFDVRTTLNISEITFYQSQSMHGYDLFASAVDKKDILYLNLFTGKVEMITGVGPSMPISTVKWGNSMRTIKSSGLFGQYMVTPSDDAIFIINGRSRTINCKIGDILHSNNIVWSHNIPSSSLTASQSESQSQPLPGYENVHTVLRQPTESTQSLYLSSQSSPQSTPSSSTSQPTVSSMIPQPPPPPQLHQSEIVNPVPVLNIHGDDQATILL